MLFSHVFLKRVVNKDITNKYTNKAAKFLISSNICFDGSLLLMLTND